MRIERAYRHRGRPRCLATMRKGRQGGSRDADKAPRKPFIRNVTGRQHMTTHRRQLMLTALGTMALAAAAGLVPAHAQDKSVTIGIELPLTVADADSATRIKNDAIMAIDD